MATYWEQNFFSLSEFIVVAKEAVGHYFLRHSVVIRDVVLDAYAVSALTLLVGRQEGHSACKKLSGGLLVGYLSEARCRLAYGPPDATATRCLSIQ